MVSLTQRLAAVLGPTLIAVTASEAINLDIWHDVPPTLTYLNGLLFFVGGMIIVTSHRQLRPVSALLVTAGGWLLLAAGSYRMFFPGGPQLAPAASTYAVIALLGAYGIALSLVGFFRR